jgi:serine/threonine protein phosphatase 1
MQEILDNESKYPELTVLPLKVIRGNHEDMMFRCCTGGASLTWWMGNGGYTTLMSYGYEDGDALMPLKGSLKEDLAWIYSLPFYIETDKQVFVHAGGLKRGKPAANHDVDELTWYCFDENWKWPDEMSGIHKDANYDKHIVHGHEQWAKGPILLSGRTDLDTFAWYTGRLAIGVFDDSQGAPIDILWVEGEPYKSP